MGGFVPQFQGLLVHFGVKTNDVEKKIQLFTVPAFCDHVNCRETSALRFDVDGQSNVCKCSLFLVDETTSVFSACFGVPQRPSVSSSQ